MEVDRYGYASVFLLSLMIVVTVYGFTQLSGDIAIHFDAAGQADGYMPLFPGILLMPAIGTFILVIFHYLPRIDPLGENYESFENLFELLQLLLIGIFTYVQAMIITWNLGHKFNPSLMVMPVVFSAYYLAGKIMEKAERNWFIGIRTPWTLSSDEVWKKTHENTSPLMKLAAAISLAALVVPEYSVYLYAAPAFLVAIFSTIYSYIIYRNTQEAD
ncbi:MAG: SdpI family protein [Candidatus Nanohaloarchaea archaeon]|nr:SdpI family protein [Candidatus Nanohaloarchaea archaeon]